MEFQSQASPNARLAIMLNPVIFYYSSVRQTKWSLGAEIRGTQYLSDLLKIGFLNQKPKIEKSNQNTCVCVFWEIVYVQQENIEA